MKTNLNFTTNNDAAQVASTGGHAVPSSFPSSPRGPLSFSKGEIMYGKKRIVITKGHQIVLAGGVNGEGGTWWPVGWLRPDVAIDGTRFASILKDQYICSTPNDPNDFESIKASSKKALKAIINKKYKWVA